MDSLVERLKDVGTLVEAFKELEGETLHPIEKKPFTLIKTKEDYSIVKINDHRSEKTPSQQGLYHIEKGILYKVD